MQYVPVYNGHLQERECRAGREGGGGISALHHLIASNNTTRGHTNIYGVIYGVSITAKGMCNQIAYPVSLSPVYHLWLYA